MALKAGLLDHDLFGIPTDLSSDNQKIERHQRNESSEEDSTKENEKTFTIFGFFSDKDIFNLNMSLSTKTALFSLMCLLLALLFRGIMRSINRPNVDYAREIMLFGVSLVKYTSDGYGLTRHMQTRLARAYPEYDITVSESGIGITLRNSFKFVKL